MMLDILLRRKLTGMGKLGYRRGLNWCRPRGKMGIIEKEIMIVWHMGIGMGIV